MGALDNITIGSTATKTVTSEMTVGHFVADMPQVYATPMMILHMEMASGSAIAVSRPWAPARQLQFEAAVLLGIISQLEVKLLKPNLMALRFAPT
jgi:hypothetical protein